MTQTSAPTNHIANRNTHNYMKQKKRLYEMYAAGGVLGMSQSTATSAFGGAGQMVDALDQGNQMGRKRVGTSVASGALSGAALGTSILPGWGTAIGAVVGAGVGLVAGKSAKRKEERQLNAMNMQREAAQRNYAANLLASDPTLTAGNAGEGYYANGGALQPAVAQPMVQGTPTDAALADYLQTTNPWLYANRDSMQLMASGGLLPAGPGPGGSDSTNTKMTRNAQGQQVVSNPRQLVNNPDAFLQSRALTIDSLSKAWNVPTTDIFTTVYRDTGGRPGAKGHVQSIKYESLGSKGRTYHQGPTMVRGMSMSQNAHGGQLHKKKSSGAVPPEMADQYRVSYANGGSIHIKPENRGKFGDWAQAHDMGTQEAARHVMANKENYSPAVVKMANFAKNASTWDRKAAGGRVVFGPKR